MVNASSMAARRLVLVGGGHSHVLVLREFALRPEPGLAITLVSPQPMTPYSGMLPGHVAGLYTFDEMHVDLVRLAARAGADYVPSAAAGFDGAGGRVLLEGGGAVAGDVISIDIGVTPALGAIPGAADHAVAVKPIGALLDKIARLREAARAGDVRRIAVIGGGASGICLTLGLAARLRDDCPDAEFDIRIIAAGGIAPEVNALARHFLRRALRRRAIRVETGRAAEVTADAVILDDGRRFGADAVLVAVAAGAPAALSNSDLSRTPEGFLAIGDDLRVCGQERIFAAGDCATMVDNPRPKAGVFAVRQGAPLARNLRAALRGGPLTPFTPQRDWLMLLSLADGTAIASRGRFLAAKGRLVWMLKDRIDRAFMRLFA